MAMGIVGSMIIILGENCLAMVEKRMKETNTHIQTKNNATRVQRNFQPLRLGHSLVYEQNTTLQGPTTRRRRAPFLLDRYSASRLRSAGLPINAQMSNT